MIEARELLPADIKACLQTGIMARRIYYLPQTVSVNDAAADLARRGEKEGTLVITDYQSGGRGRLNRKWHSPAGKNLLFALILRPDGFAWGSLLTLSLAFSNSIAEVLEKALKVPVGVKWPNDVFAPGGKICGILADGSIKGGRPAYVVIGIGINVNMRVEDLPADLKGGAVSCSMIRGEPVQRRFLLAAVLEEIEAAYMEFSSAGFKFCLDAYNKRLILAGRKIRFTRDGADYIAVARSVREDGSLEVGLIEGGSMVLYNEEIHGIE